MKTSANMNKWRFQLSILVGLELAFAACSPSQDSAACNQTESCAAIRIDGPGADLPLRVDLIDAQGQSVSRYKFPAFERPAIIRMDVSSQAARTSVRCVNVRSTDFLYRAMMPVRWQAGQPLSTALSLQATPPLRVQIAQPRPIQLGGSNSRSLSMVDLNQDGNLDLAVTNVTAQGVGQVSIFLGDGHGGLVMHSANPSHGQPYSIAAQDLDGDGYTDLVVGSDSTTQKTLSILFGHGDGTFEPQQLLTLTGPANFVALGDITGDGRPEIFAASELEDSFRIIRIQENRVLQADSTAITCGIEPRGIVVADLDGDGDYDLVTSNYKGQSLSAFYNDGQGHLTPSPLIGLPARPGIPAVTAVDDDVNRDFIVPLNLQSDGVSPDQRLLLIRGKDDMQPTDKSLATIGLQPRMSAAVDFNGDQTIDGIAIENASGKLSLVPRDYMGQFGQALSFESIANGYYLAIGDLDGDCLPDFAVAGEGGNFVNILMNISQ